MKKGTSFLFGAISALALAVVAVVVIVELEPEVISLAGSKATFGSGGVVQIDKLQINYGGGSGEKLTSVDVQARPGGVRPTRIDSSLQTFESARVVDRAFWTKESHTFTGTAAIVDEPNWAANQKYTIVVTVSYVDHYILFTNEKSEVFVYETPVVVTDGYAPELEFTRIVY